jgi:hypothetical protein
MRRDIDRWNVRLLLDSQCEYTSSGKWDVSAAYQFYEHDTVTFGERATICTVLYYRTREHPYGYYTWGSHGGERSMLVFWAVKQCTLAEDTNVSKKHNASTFKVDVLKMETVCFSET